VTASSAKPPPRPVRQRLRLLTGWVTHLWRVGWQEAYLAVEDPSSLGPAPQIADLRAHLSSLLQGNRP
jgi:hypothetical protein